MFGVIVPSCLVLIVIYARIYLIFKQTVSFVFFFSQINIMIFFQIKRRTKSIQNINNIKITQKTPSILFSCFRTKAVLQQGDDLRAREIRTTIVLFITVLFFGVCWIPLYLIDILSFFAPESVENIDIMTINALIIMRHVNSVFNPFLYAYHMKGFTKAAKYALLKIFCCRLKRHPGWNNSHLPSSTDNSL